MAAEMELPASPADLAASQPRLSSPPGPVGPPEWSMEHGLALRRLGAAAEKQGLAADAALLWGFMAQSLRSQGQRDTECCIALEAAVDALRDGPSPGTPFSVASQRSSFGMSSSALQRRALSSPPKLRDRQRTSPPHQMQPRSPPFDPAAEYGGRFPLPSPHASPRRHAQGHAAGAAPPALVPELMPLCPVRPSWDGVPLACQLRRRSHGNLVGLPAALSPPSPPGERAGWSHRRPAPKPGCLPQQLLDAPCPVFAERSSRRKLHTPEPLARSPCASASYRDIQRTSVVTLPQPSDDGSELTSPGAGTMQSSGLMLSASGLCAQPITSSPLLPIAVPDLTVTAAAYSFPPGGLHSGLSAGSGSYVPSTPDKTRVQGAALLRCASGRSSLSSSLGSAARASAFGGSDRPTGVVLPSPPREEPCSGVGSTIPAKDISCIGSGPPSPSDTQSPRSQHARLGRRKSSFLLRARDYGRFGPGAPAEKPAAPLLLRDATTQTNWVGDERVSAFGRQASVRSDVGSDTGDSLLRFRHCDAPEYPAPRTSPTQTTDTAAGPDEPMSTLIDSLHSSTSSRSLTGGSALAASSHSAPSSGAHILASPPR
eukprot:TRINITY_DN4116_c0_g1_i1.p1 TRINITY_DN4116_c0_g1~~TRINITY_DN4116_c0_g1_i1.p1  ORF type:complete len:623 (+),score=131.89 TRINITY_DN4116_c0_g1_i1:73-1869(+)